MSTPTLARLRAEAVAELCEAGIDDPAGEARWMLEQATGLSAVELVTFGQDPVTRRAVVALDSMLARRRRGEPLQYVLGRWGFLGLDLMVDARVLIPRPETEVVAEVALAELGTLRGEGGPAGGRLVVDLGTGSGALALALAAATWPAARIWATDRSEEALAVARANVAGLGRRGSAVRLAHGDWYGALPTELAGRVDLIVSNPPYVASGDELPDEVARFEPLEALLAGPSGLEAVGAVLAGAKRWLAPGAAIVVEIGDSQGGAGRSLAAGAGLVDVEVRPDLTGRDRVLVARRPPGVRP